jgi:hypothetical protein
VHIEKKAKRIEDVDPSPLLLHRGLSFNPMLEVRMDSIMYMSLLVNSIAA